MQPRHSERPRQASLEKPTACRRLADGMSPLSSRQKTSRLHLAKDPLIHAFFYLLDLCFYLHLYLLLFRCILLDKSVFRTEDRHQRHEEEERVEDGPRHHGDKKRTEEVEEDRVAHPQENRGPDRRDVPRTYVESILTNFRSSPEELSRVSSLLYRRLR